MKDVKDVIALHENLREKYKREFAQELARIVVNMPAKDRAAFLKDFNKKFRKATSQ